MSKIEWTNQTWNPVTGCTKHSEGCQNCYAEKMTKRLKAMGQEKYKNGFEKVCFHPSELYRDFGKKPKMIFVNSMSDTFHKDVLNREVQNILNKINKPNQHRHSFQILTKRAERLPDFNYPKNVWLGVTVELEKYKERIEFLKQTDAKIKFLSCEPLLGDLGELDLTGIDWVICGGESGSKARPMHPDWVRNIQRQCKEQNVAFFFKQWGEWRPVCNDESCFFANRMSIQGKVILYDGSVIDGIFPKQIEEFEKRTGKDVGILRGNIAFKVGKKKAGGFLDGVEYKEFPNYIVEFEEMEV